MNVTDFPIWSDCPFSELIPSMYTVRKQEENVAVVWQNGETVKHVNFLYGEQFNDLHKLSLEGFKEHLVKPVLSSLAGSIVLDEFGDLFSTLHRDLATHRSFGHKTIPEKYRSLVTRLVELNPTDSFFSAVLAADSACRAKETPNSPSALDG